MKKIAVLIGLFSIVITSTTSLEAIRRGITIEWDTLRSSYAGRNHQFVGSPSLTGTVEVGRTEVGSPVRLHCEFEVLDNNNQRSSVVMDFTGEVATFEYLDGRPYYNISGNWNGTRTLDNGGTVNIDTDFNYILLMTGEGSPSPYATTVIYMDGQSAAWQIQFISNVNVKDSGIMKKMIGTDR